MARKAGQALATRADQRAFGDPPLHVACQHLVSAARKAAATSLVRAGAAPGRVTDYDNVNEADVVVDHCAISEGGKRPRLDAPRYADAKDEILLAQPPILDQRRKHQLWAGEILAVGDARAIVAPEKPVLSDKTRVSGRRDHHSDHEVRTRGNSLSSIFEPVSFPVTG